VEIIFYFFLAFIFPFLWIFYFYLKDKHPEPFLWLFLAFLLGISSAIISYYFQDKLHSFLLKDWLKFFVFALIEEFFKFFLIWLFIFHQRVFDEPVDAMIYMMFSAVGFAFLENSIFIFKPGIISIFSVLVFRFFGANLLHVLASSLIGYGYAFFVKTRRIFPLIISFISATFLHFFYNYLIINLPPGFILILPILWSVFLVVLSELNYLTQNG
jgi:RsiW-degrading membrane proteinase PrsW (M82 family)